ncbi:MAG: DUF4445 domain-containing protein [Clostridia bacterium]|nr:DUF4445 domain-containing protein [Clostridia bacterium]
MKRKILILPDEKVIFAEDGENLLGILASVGVSLPAACGGRGTCGKCRVRLISGRVAGTEADACGEILACHASVCEDLVLSIPQSAGSGLDRFLSQPLTGGAAGLCAVLDVGTTTLALCLLDRATGEILQRRTALNPQGVLGADVLSRIGAWGAGKGLLLQRLLLDRVCKMLDEVSGGRAIDMLTVAANTTMLHLFLNVDPTTIGVYPFTPRFTDTQWVTGEALGLPVSRVCLLPSVSGYIGGDVTAGAVACGMDRTDETLLLVDVGTNGEIMLSHKGALYATSAAAGPAFEGACIECGMGGVAGAVDHVTLTNGELAVSTVGGTAPRGICGSGLIDLIALLLREGLLDESGAWADDAASPLCARLRGDRFYLGESVYLSQKDIRQYQLAKSAIVSGILVLLDSCGVRVDEVSRVMIAGGLGYYMNVESAAQTGLLPASLASRTESVGNTALAGARLCACDPDGVSRVERLARATRVVELGGSTAFSEAYMMNMLLGEV